MESLSTKSNQEPDSFPLRKNQSLSNSSRSSYDYNLQYKPNSHEIIEKYEFVERIYDEKLSPSFVDIVIRKSDNARVIKKVTEKSKLFSQD